MLTSLKKFEAFYSFVSNQMTGFSSLLLDDLCGEIAGLERNQQAPVTVGAWRDVDRTLSAKSEPKLFSFAKQKGGQKNPGGLHKPKTSHNGVPKLKNPTDWE